MINKGCVSAALSFALAAALYCAPAAAQAPAPAAPAAPAAKDGYKVLETYEVGPIAYVRALTVERDKNVLWVGTSAGVHEIDLAANKPKNTFTRKDGLANEYVFAVGIDTQGYKWFGTNAGGVSRYKDGKWKTIFPMHGLADYWIYAFANDKKGDLWIGTWAGANHYNIKTGKYTTYVKELVNEWVYGLDVDKDGRVWFGTEGGVSLYDGKTWKSWTHKDGLGAENESKLPASANTGLGTRQRHDLSIGKEGMATYNPSYVFSISADPSGVVYAGTWGGGVGRFDGKKWTNLTTKEGLAGNIVYSMAREPSGVYWFGTNKGVSRYDGRTFRNFTTQDGLLDGNVYAVAITPAGDVWVGTKKGVARIGRGK